MFEIGFPELILIAIVGLLVIGPERLPEALRTLGLWVGRMRRSFTNVKTEIEKEIGMDEIRRQLHNEAVMEEMKRIERDVRKSVHAGEHAASEDAAGEDAGSSRTPPEDGDESSVEQQRTGAQPPATAPPSAPTGESAEPPAARDTTDATDDHRQHG